MPSYKLPERVEVHGSKDGNPNVLPAGEFVSVSDLHAIRSQERQRVREELLRDVDSGGLTRHILDALELPADDPNTSSWAQTSIQGAIQGWFYTTCWHCKKRVLMVDATDWEERPCPDNGEYECSWCPTCVAGETR